ncbi:MAG: beta-lactamase family protein [Gemmatimonadetes bacterium]|nr:beta-lactamase family protein [Gemmatimonadota bacterium]
MQSAGRAGRPGARSLLALAGALVAALAACDTIAPPPDRYPHEREAIGTVRESYDGTLSDSLAVHTFRNIHRLFPTRVIAAPRRPRALPPSARTLPAFRFSIGDSTYDLSTYMERNRVAGLLILADGRIAVERYRYGNGPRTRWMSMSIAKSVSATLVGAALRDGLIRSIDDSVTRYVPSLAGSAYEGVSIRDVLMMSSGVRWTERYTDPTSDRRRLLEAQIAQLPGGALAVMRALPRAAPPGTVNTYSTGETQVLAEVLRGALKRPLAEYLSERIWQPLGTEAEARWWLDSPDGVEIGGSGISATLRDYGRFGQFILDEGIIGTDTVLPPGWVAEATSAKFLRDGTPLEYGYMWWPATTPAGRGDRAFSAQGIHGQFLYVNPAARVVIVVWSAQPAPVGGAVIEDERVFDAIAAEFARLTARTPARFPARR